MQSTMHAYEVRPRKDKRGVDLISDALPFGRLWYEDASAAVDYAKHSSRSHDVVICVYDEAGSVIETHQHPGDFRKPYPRQKRRFRPARAPNAMPKQIKVLP